MPTGHCSPPLPLPSDRRPQIALNFALLASSEAHLDMVTNATAVLCILEMDSAMLAADEDQIKARLCAFAYRYGALHS